MFTFFIITNFKQQIYHITFYSIFRTTLEVSSKLYFLKYLKSQRNYGFLITKELIFGFQILKFKRSLLSILNNIFSSLYDRHCWLFRTFYRAQISLIVLEEKFFSHPLVIKGDTIFRFFAHWSGLFRLALGSSEPLLRVTPGT